MSTQRLVRKTNEFKSHLKYLKKIDLILFFLLFISLLSLSIWLGLTKLNIYDDKGYLSISIGDIIISAFACLITFLYIVLVSRGRREGFLYGVISQVLWGISAIASNIPFQIILRFCLFLPITIFGLITWIWDDKITLANKDKQMKDWIVALIFILIFSLSVLMTYSLQSFSSLGIVYVDGIKQNNRVILFLDIALFLLGTTATVLTVLNYNSAWTVWVITNIWGISFYLFYAFAFSNWIVILGSLGWFYNGINSIRVWYIKTNENRIKNNYKSK